MTPGLAHHRGRPWPTDITSGFQLLVSNLMLLEASHGHISPRTHRRSPGQTGVGVCWQEFCEGCGGQHFDSQGCGLS